MAWIIKLFTVCVFITFSPVKCLEWSEDDAIYIEDGALGRARPEISEDFSEKFGLNTTQRPPPVVTAIPVEIIPGQCVKASECYPILFYRSEEEELQVVDENLYKFILSTANACEPSDLPDRARLDIEGSEDVYIWCPQKTFSSKPKVPSSNPIAETNDLNEIQCGPVKTTEDEELNVRVVGGEIVEKGSLPWMVAITNKGKLFCSGSLIDESHVLLAAHCLSHLRYRDLKHIKVLIGDHSIRDQGEIQHQERNVSAVIYHKNFTMRTVHSDVGLIRLSTPVEYAENIAPICLSNGSMELDDGGTYALLSGWGAIKEGYKVSDTLMKATIRIWRQEECVKKYEDFVPGGILSSMFCAGSVAPVVKDSCKGDSGAPLSLIVGNRTEQIGIVSFGIGCGRAPGVFSRISNFLPWIIKHKSQSAKYFL